MIPGSPGSDAQRTLESMAAATGVSASSKTCCTNVAVGEDAAHCCRRSRRPHRRRHRVGHKLAPLRDAHLHKVVVVDDELLIRRSVTSQLLYLGVEDVVALDDGDQLVGHLGSCGGELPTCVLLDMMMLRSFGVDVLMEVRARKEWQHVSVYAMTSNVESEELFIEAGFDGLLGKPFRRSEVAKVLAHSLQPRAKRKQFIRTSWA